MSADRRGRPGEHRLGLTRSGSRGQGTTCRDTPVRPSSSLVAVSVGLVPWTLWLTYSLPSRHVDDHYDVAWVGFDVALALAIALTAGAALRGSRALAPLAAVTGTMLLCDAWFDVVTSPGTLEALLLAVCAELPLAALCLLLVRRVARSSSRAGARAARREARARRTRRASRG